ncbi:ATP-dependent helicase [Pseudarthrobacter sp. MM222]|uniref:ATP-dependent helicase n=1 Tax=Pseudarthrobacter sp. MM222 TaxID=3018929 RepID=UPI002220809D|nr:ATP-dependent helicase [Pseudarthrobacter sp. MM222]CAI3793974.1 ATP-dependent DNA helicase Rep [Pseudarthrobacter sp. MM222]
MPAEFKLDESQEAVTFAPLDSRQFVLAAAGQGKTEVLLSRIQYLIDEGLNPADEILVLSFSRAAVEAVRKRARKFEIESVPIRTFDSLAAQILLDNDDGDGEALTGSFEGRIRRATQLISGDLPDRLASVRHLLIDEAQDLVGDRAEMVKAIISEAPEDLGFTVLGDPLQGIYDFQLQDSVSQFSSQEFISDLQERYGAIQRQLKGNYRALSDQALELIEIGKTIRTMDLLDDAEVAAAHQMLDDFRTNGGTTPSLLDESGALDPAEGETTALLCSTNYEVLLASELLWEHDRPHVVRRRAQDMSVAPWVFAVFKDLEGRSYPEDVILARMESEGLDSPQERWLDLKTAEGDYRSFRSLDVARLGQRLRNRSVPLALTVSDASPVTVSTVHRAKGLEFNNVLYVPPITGWPSAERTAATLRDKYVAVSRARELVVTTHIPKDRVKPSKSVGSVTRWTEIGFGRFKKTYTIRMEFLNGDIDDVLPAETSGCSPQDVQDRLLAGDIVGQSVQGTLEDSSDVYEMPRYVLRLASGEVIGRTSNGFGYALKGAFQTYGRPWNWPEAFTGARLVSVECATGNPLDTQYAGIGYSGMWLVPRAAGLIRLQWKK